MGAGNAGKGDSGQVSGNEAFYSKQPNSTMNKGVNVSTYGDRNIGEQSFVNFKPEQNKFAPVALQVASKVLDGLTGATKKNRQFLVDNYERIGKNYKTPG